MRTSAILAALAASLASAQDLPPCPRCTTTTVTVAPPCVPDFCTSYSTITTATCTTTRYSAVTTSSGAYTQTVHAVNPGCPYTPRATYQLSCPTPPPCVVYECPATQTLIVEYTASHIDYVVETEAPLVCTPTEPGIPFPPSTTFTWPTDGPTPPPLPTFDPDPCDTDEGCWER